MIELLTGNRPAPGPFLIQGVYSAKAGSLTARNGQCNVLIDNFIYSYGGSYGSPNNTMERYDINSDSWSTVTFNNAPPAARHSPAFCLLNNKLYMFGGSTGVNWGPMTNEAWSYDFSTKLWTQLANYPASLALCTAVAIDGKIYILGGFTGSGPSTPFHEYDPVANTYRAITHSLSARYGHKAVAIKGKMYVFAGSTGPTAVTEARSYDPATNTWVTLKPAPEGKAHSYVAAIGDMVYLYGGRQGSEPSAIIKLYRYNTLTGNWTELPSGSSRLYLGACVATSDALYLHGGWDGVSQSANTLIKIT